MSRRRQQSVGAAGRVPSSNFRHYPGDDGPTRPFVTVPQAAPVSAKTKITVSPQSTSRTGDSDNPSEPDSLSFHTATTGSPPSEPNPRRPPNLDQVTSEVFSSSATNLELYPHIGRPSPPRAQRATNVSMSDTSIVHLPPCNPEFSLSPRSRGAPSLSGSSQAASEHASDRDPQSTDYLSCSSSQHARSTSQSIYGSLPFSHEGGLDGVGPSLAVGTEGSLTSLLQSSASAGSGSSVRDSSGGRNAGEESHVTFRFEHREDGNGHHVVIGREGKLSRCEDEVRVSSFCAALLRVVHRNSFIVRMGVYQPIRTPGAVQGFGVLVVVQEDTEGDQLLVRQVSENSTELLGLSPRYLFSLTCFTDVLPDSQAGILWDNIQYLADTDEDSPGEDAPHVFLLSGWGMPGSALLGEGDPQRRRSWSCWCAAHRPKMAAGSSCGAIQNLIILEFELEHDVFNPLYPATSEKNGDALSGLSSLGSNSSASTISTGTSSTLFSSATSPLDTDSATANSASTLGPNSSPSEGALISSSVSSPIRQAHSQPPSGLEGDDSWKPSTEDILESTTNCAKPLAALERIRKLSQVVQPFSGTEHGVGSISVAMGGSVSGSSARTRRNKRRGGSGAVGMMDVFAVMSQVNEQLSAAPDLETFLKVVVGLVKDLTQFHRVLVYQFDENWNGQTVAELVDWDRTHDLYRGLCFPASDIPAQVGG